MDIYYGVWHVPNKYHVLQPDIYHGPLNTREQAQT